MRKLLFILDNRLRKQAKVSLHTAIKRPAGITLGIKTKVHAHATLDAGAGGIVLGDQVTINRYAMIQGDGGGVRIGHASEVNNFAIVNGTGGVTIGRDVLIGPGAKLISYQHEFGDPAVLIRKQPCLRDTIVIEDDCWIGANAIIMAGVTVGRGSVIGAGAVVNRSCPANSVVVGVPGRVIKMRATQGAD